MHAQDKRATRRNRIFAIAAGGAVLGLGVTATLAAWTDAEWVRGGSGADGSGPGVGTEIFQTQQYVFPNVNDLDLSAATWSDPADHMTQADANVMNFSAGALALEPGGDPVYAAVAVRTTDTTTLDGTLALQGAVLGAGDSADLAAALDLRVAYAEDSLAACDADAFGPGSIIVDTTLAAGTPATSTQAVDKEAGNVLIYCFELSLPADESTNQALMGQTVSPSWEIRAES